MKKWHIGMSAVLAMSFVLVVRATPPVPPTVQWPAGWQILNTGMPSQAPAGIEAGWIRAIHYENGRPDAQIALLYTRGIDGNTLAGDLQDATDNANTLARKADATLKCSTPSPTQLGTLMALATECALTKGSFASRESIITARGENQNYTIYYAATALNYTKYQPQMRFVLDSFRVPPSDETDVAVEAGYYGFYVLVLGLGIALLVKLRGKKKTSVPPPFPSQQ